MIKQCKLCKNKFEVIGTKNAHQIYCDRCRHRNCKFCDNEFRIYPRPNSNRNENIYCSKICRAKDLTEEKANHWKGDDVGYFGLHVWINKKLGKPKKCEFCGITTGKLEWANKSHNYKRDLDDWIGSCVPCHKIYDGNNKKRNLSFSGSV